MGPTGIWWENWLLPGRDAGETLGAVQAVCQDLDREQGLMGGWVIVGRTVTRRYVRKTVTYTRNKRIYPIPVDVVNMTLVNMYLRRSLTHITMHSGWTCSESEVKLFTSRDHWATFPCLETHLANPSLLSHNRRT